MFSKFGPSVIHNRSFKKFVNESFRKTLTLHIFNEE